MTGNAADNNAEDFEHDDRADGFGSTRKLTDSHYHQISVLRSMSQNEEPAKEPKQLQIEEIRELSGLEDEKEVQRYLFILEGQKLVSPYPEGDFTSKTWKITKTGMKALKTIEKSTVNQ